MGQDTALTPNRLLAGLAAAAEVLVVAALAVDTVLTAVNTLLRYLLHRDLPWAPEISQILVCVVAFLGAPAFFRRSRGMAYLAVLEALRGRARRGMEATGLWLVIGVCTLTLFAYPEFFMAQTRQMLPVLDLNHGIVAIWLGLGLLLLALFAAERLAATGWDGAALGLAGALGVAGVTFALRYAYAAGVELDPFWVLVPLLAFAFAAGTPIPLILALGGSLFFVATGDAPLVAIPAAFQYGLASFILLAIPFFMLAGTLMEVSGMAGRLVGAVQHWVGHWTGGLLIAEVMRPTCSPASVAPRPLTWRRSAR